MDVRDLAQLALAVIADARHVAHALANVLDGMDKGRITVSESVIATEVRHAAKERLEEISQEYNQSEELIDGFLHAHTLATFEPTIYH